MERTTLSLNSDTRQQIDEVYMAYYLAKDFRHAIRQRNGYDDWKLFWPSSFILPFFNTLYSLKWRELLDNGLIQTWNLNTKNPPTESMQMRAMVGLFYDILVAKLQNMYPSFRTLSLILCSAHQARNSLLAATAFTDDLCPLIQAVFVGDFPGIQL